MTFITSCTNNYFNACPPPLSFSIISLLFHISFIHVISLPFSFSISPRSFPSLSLILLHPFHMCSILSLSFFIAHSAPSFLSFQPIPVFSLLVPTSKSRHLFGILMSSIVVTWTESSYCPIEAKFIFYLVQEI
jgi:hypothetical protein